MNPLIAEINEIPLRASEFLKHSPEYKLPLRVPYLGMGSSYFAPLAFKYMGINIYPELQGPDRIEFDSMINIRPSQGNRSRGVDDPKVRERIIQIVAGLMK